LASAGEGETAWFPQRRKDRAEKIRSAVRLRGADGRPRAWIDTSANVLYRRRRQRETAE